MMNNTRPDDGSDDGDDGAFRDFESEIAKMSKDTDAILDSIRQAALPTPPVNKRNKRSLVTLMEMKKKADEAAAAHMSQGEATDTDDDDMTDDGSVPEEVRRTIAAEMERLDTKFENDPAAVTKEIRTVSQQQSLFSPIMADTDDDDMADDGSLPEEVRRTIAHEIDTKSETNPAAATKEIPTASNRVGTASDQHSLFFSIMGSLLVPTRVILVLFVITAVCSAWAPGLSLPPLLYRPSSSSLSTSPASQEDMGKDECTATAAAATSPVVKGITLKIAVDSQGGVADLAASKSDRFTSPASLDRVHRLRREAQAILIGKDTVVFDNPSLTIRRNVMPPPQPPVRVVLDSRLSLLIDRIQDGRMYQLFEDGLATIVYHSMDDIDEESLNLPETVTLVRVPIVADTDPSAPRLDVAAVWQDLQSTHGVDHLMVEGGPMTAQSFLQAGLVDRVILINANGITFSQPVPSAIAADVLQAANLQCVGTFEEEGDTTECWVRTGAAWPTTEISSWP